LRATKAPITAEGAAKVLKESHSGHILQNLVVKNEFTKCLAPTNGLFCTNLSKKN